MTRLVLNTVMATVKGPVITGQCTPFVYQVITPSLLRGFKAIMERLVVGEKSFIATMKYLMGRISMFRSFWLRYEVLDTCFNHVVPQCFGHYIKSGGTTGNCQSAFIHLI